MKIPFVILPAVSVVEQFTVVKPTGKIEPELGVQVTVGLAGSVSTAVAVYVIAFPAELVASCVIFDGRLRVGATVSGV